MKPRYCPPFTPMVDILPEMENDYWIIEHEHTTEEKAKSLKMASIFSWSYGDYYDLESGDYVRLRDAQSNYIWMTDTPMERRTNLEIIERAHGRVLIGGLGIGMIVVPIVAKPEVTELYIVEKDEQLIEMIRPHLTKNVPFAALKIKYICADMFDYFPSKDERFNVVYFDIWSSISGDNNDEMSFLHRRWAHRMDKSDPERWLSSWRRRDAQKRRY